MREIKIQGVGVGRRLKGEGIYVELWLILSVGLYGRNQHNMVNNYPPIKIKRIHY